MPHIIAECYFIVQLYIFKFCLLIEGHLTWFSILCTSNQAFMNIHVQFYMNTMFYFSRKKLLGVWCLDTISIYASLLFCTWKSFCTMTHHPSFSGQKFVHKTTSLSLLSAFDMHRRYLSLILIGGSQYLTKVIVHVSYYIPWR